MAEDDGQGQDPHCLSVVIHGGAWYRRVRGVLDHERHGCICPYQQRPLGDRAVSESTTALEANAEASLLQSATDQADISNVVFLQVDSEMDTLAGYAASVQARSGAVSPRPLYSV